MPALRARHVSEQPREHFVRIMFGEHVFKRDGKYYLHGLPFRSRSGKGTFGVLDMRCWKSER